MLDDQARAILDFERGRWKYVGAKEAAIRETFGCSTVRYYQRLNVLLDDPAAVEYAPMVVARLRRLREARRAVRTAR